MMKIEFERIDSDYHMRATNEEGVSAETDGSLEIGGHNVAMRPMQLMLVGLGSCSSIDVISILRKMKQPLEDIKISVEAEREQGKQPSLFTSINVHYRLFGKLDPEKAERAIELSMTKYCSVAKIIEKTAKIDYSFEIIEN